MITRQILSLYSSLPLSDHDEKGERQHGIAPVPVPPEDLRGVGIHLTRLQYYNYDTGVGGREDTFPSRQHSVEKLWAAKRAFPQQRNRDFQEVNESEESLEEEEESVEKNPGPKTKRTFGSVERSNSSTSQKENAKVRGGYLLPSLSQIDQDILTQLPVDIKKEIKESLKSDKNRVEPDSHLSSFFDRNQETRSGRKRKRRPVSLPHDNLVILLSPEGRANTNIPSLNRKIDQANVSPLSLTQQVLRFVINSAEFLID